MKKKFITAVTVCVSLFIFPSCSSDEQIEIPEPISGKNVVTIGVGKEDTRTSYEQKNGSLAVVWEEGDQIYVHGRKEDGTPTLEKFTLIEGAGTKNGKFQSLKSDITPNNAARDRKIQIIYPAPDFLESNKVQLGTSAIPTSYITYDLPWQSGTLEQMNRCDLMYGSGELTGSGNTFNTNGNVSMYHELCVFRCTPKFPATVNNVYIENIKITGAANQYRIELKHSGYGTMVYDEHAMDMGTIEVTPRTSENGYLIKIVNGIAKSADGTQNMDFYVRLLPGHEPHGSQGHEINQNKPLDFFITLSDGRVFHKKLGKKGGEGKKFYADNDRNDHSGEYHLTLNFDESKYVYAFNDGKIATLEDYYSHPENSEGYPIAWVIDNPNNIDMVGEATATGGGEKPKRIAIGLIDATDGTKNEYAWRTGTDTSLDNYNSDGTPYSAFSSQATDWDGYGHTYNPSPESRAPYYNGMKTENPNFPAFKVVGSNYGMDENNLLPNGQKPVPYDTYSKWFVPSGSQWQAYAENNLEIVFDKNKYVAVPIYTSEMFSMIANDAMTRKIPSGKYIGCEVGKPMLYGKYICSSEDVASNFVPVTMLWGREEVSEALTRLRISSYGGEGYNKNTPVFVRPFIAVPGANTY